MLSFSVLASSSKANCTYIRSRSTQVLIDCGLSCRELEKRLRSIGVCLSSIDALVITHEHRDHVAGIPFLFKKHRPRIFANSGTICSCEVFQTGKLSVGFSSDAVAKNGGPKKNLFSDCFQEFETGSPFSIGDIYFEPFSVTHDASDPVGFRISSGEAALTIATDLGQLTALVRERVRGIDALILEANHDPQLLLECSYPWELKERIRSRFGHLSNDEAASLVQELSEEGEGRLQVIIAAHISEKSNFPERALEKLQEGWSRDKTSHMPEFLAASPYVPTRLISITQTLPKEADDQNQGLLALELSAPLVPSANL